MDPWVDSEVPRWVDMESVWLTVEDVMDRAKWV